jgi:hypothetical protein
VKRVRCYGRSSSDSRTVCVRSAVQLRAAFCRSTSPMSASALPFCMPESRQAASGPVTTGQRPMQLYGLPAPGALGMFVQSSERNSGSERLLPCFARLPQFDHYASDSPHQLVCYGANILKSVRRRTCHSLIKSVNERPYVLHDTIANHWIEASLAIYRHIFPRQSRAQRAYYCNFGCRQRTHP